MLERIVLRTVPQFQNRYAVYSTGFDSRLVDVSLGVCKGSVLVYLHTACQPSQFELGEPVQKVQGCVITMILAQLAISICTHIHTRDIQAARVLKHTR